MSLYEQWGNYFTDNCKTPAEQKDFWNQYCMEEKELYQKILGNKTQVIEGCGRRAGQRKRNERCPVHGIFRWH